MIIQGVTLNGVNVVDASIITQNLAIWIDANDSASYPGSGTSVTDLSGNSRTQNLSNALAYTMLTGVKCWDCSSTYNIRAASATTTLPTGGFTYIVWARMIASSAGWRTLLRTSPDDHPILIETGTNRLGMYDNSSSIFYPSGYNDVSALANIWVQWVVTGDNAGQTFYINGQQVGTTVQTTAGNAHDYLGGVSGQPFGYVANMFLYTTKLTQQQIQQNYYYLADRFTQTAAVTSDLVLWYDPAKGVSYPGTGSTVTNLASTSLAGTMTNITFISPYFTHNGTSSTVSVADNALLEPGSGDFTLEAWVYYSVLAGSTRTFISKTNNGGAAADWSYGFRTNGTTGAVYLEVGNGTTTVTSPTFTVTTGIWYQIVGVWTNIASNSIALYVNGASQGSNAHSFASVKNSTNPLYLGSYNGGEYSQWFNGRMGVVRYYSAALTGAQILQNYNADKGIYGI